MQHCNLHKRVSTVDQHVALCIVAHCEEYTLCCCVRVCVKAVPTPFDQVLQCVQGKKAPDKPKPKLQPLVLAVWWFVHPYVAAEFGEYIKEVFGHAAGIVGFKPQPQHYSNMYAFGDAHTIAGRASVLCLHQGPGDIVRVTPGWPHAVLNMLPCFKLAWDYLEMSHMATYLAVHRDIASPLFRGDETSQDYMAVAPVLSNMIVARYKPAS